MPQDPPQETKKKVDESAEPLPTLLPLLAGADAHFDGSMHVGIAVEVTTAGKPGHLMIPDANNFDKGTPVFITAPIRLNLKSLKEFLASRKVTLPKEVSDLLTRTHLSCEAFYWAKDPTQKPNEDDRSTLLMTFTIVTDKGIIGTLTGDSQLGDLFDVKGVTVRVLRCNGPNRSVLVKYVQDLEAAR